MLIFVEIYSLTLKNQCYNKHRKVNIEPLNNTCLLHKVEGC